MLFLSLFHPLCCFIKPNGFDFHKKKQVAVVCLRLLSSTSALFVSPHRSVCVQTYLFVRRCHPRRRRRQRNVKSIQERVRALLVFLLHTTDARGRERRGSNGTDWETGMCFDINSHVRCRHLYVCVSGRYCCCRGRDDLSAVEVVPFVWLLTNEIYMR